MQPASPAAILDAHQRSAREFAELSQVIPFRAEAGDLDGTAQAVVDVATIGLLQDRSLRQQEILTEQLQTAPNSRVVIEQAKGLVAERLGVNGLKLSHVASGVIDGRTATRLLGVPGRPRRPEQ